MSTLAELGSWEPGTLWKGRMSANRPPVSQTERLPT